MHDKTCGLQALPPEVRYPKHHDHPKIRAFERANPVLFQDASALVEMETERLWRETNWERRVAEAIRPLYYFDGWTDDEVFDFLYPIAMKKYHLLEAKVDVSTKPQEARISRREYVPLT